MNRRNRGLLAAFLGLIILNILFAAFSGQSNREVSFDEQVFTLADTSSVQRITIGDRIDMERSLNGFLSKEDYAVDPTLSRLLLNIMSRIRVKKPVQVEAIEGQNIAFYGDEPLSFQVWGNATKTKTYALLEGSDEVYEVYIPGYNEYVGGIFELHPDQWRDRLVLNASWRTIQSLSLDYTSEIYDDVNILFEDEFFKVEGVEPIDSSAVIDYLNQFQYFQANEWISKGRFERYDSLSKKPPLATLKIETINENEPVWLEIHPNIEGENFHLVSIYDGSMMVIDRQRVQNILAKRALFQYP